MKFESLYERVIGKETFKHFELFSEHFEGLKYPKAGKEIDDVRSSAKKYLQTKGVDADTIEFWMAPQSSHRERESIYLPFVYNEEFLKRVEFTFSYDEAFNPNQLKLDPKDQKQKEKAFKNSVKTGVPFFKDLMVRGSTSAEREEFILDSSKNFLEKKAPSICVLSVNGQRTIIDGKHRVWLAQKIIQERQPVTIKAYVVTGFPLIH